MKIEYEIVKKEDLDDDHRKILSEMLSKQGEVQGDTLSKADRCKLICIAKMNSKVVSIGAIKIKTISDFSRKKSGLTELAKEFEWELGYLFTDSDFIGKGIASTIVRILLECYGEENLMASTEISKNPAMVKILKRNGFILHGKPWKSSIHKNYLGLYLRFKKS